MKIEKLINPLHLEDLKNEMHSSIFSVDDAYTLFILRLPVIDVNLQASSFGFVFTDKKSFYYDKERQEFVALKHRFDAPHEFIDAFTDKLLVFFETFREKIIRMEEILYSDNEEKNFMNQWLGLKRDILRIERILIKSSETLLALMKHYENDLSFPKDHYADLHEHIDRVMRSATVQLSKLDYVYSFYNARTSEKMNKMIYILTIISAVFLPLNLVVGFFGMNTSGLPFSKGEDGTVSAVVMMAFLLIVSLGFGYVYKRSQKENQGSFFDT